MKVYTGTTTEQTVDCDVTVNVYLAARMSKLQEINMSVVNLLSLSETGRQYISLPGAIHRER